MSSVLFAKNAMRDLATKAAETVNNPRLSNAQKKSILDKIEVDIKEHAQTINIHESAGRLMVGGSALGSNEGFIFGQRSTSARAPRLTLTEADTRAMFDAATTKQTLRLNVETKAAMDPAGLLPAQLLPGIVAMPHEPVRLLDHIPATPMEGPSVEFISHTSTTGAPGMVAKGGTKPEVEFNTVSTILVARKIAGWASLLDEDLMDFPAFTSYLQNELVRVVTDVENTQVLSGDGTGENLLGLFNQVGILTRDHSADVTADPNATGLDTLEMAIADLRTGPAFVEPDSIVLHPTTWSKLRRTKTTYGQYILNADPSSVEANSLWGIPVLATTTCPVGSALVANLEQGAQAFVRQGFTLEVSNNSGTSFITNTTVFRAEERLTIGSTRPKALLAVSNL